MKTLPPYLNRATLLSLLVMAGVFGCDGDGDDGADSCNHPDRDCTLREAAEEIGFYVGSISGDRGDGSSVLIDPPYAEALLEHFNSMTVENLLKMGSIAPNPGAYEFEEADRAVDFALANGLRVRGHALIWARLNGLPGWLPDAVHNAPDPEAYLRNFIETYIAEVVGRYRGRIPSWDVVNEPLHLADGVPDPASLFEQVLGEEYIDLAFRAAREADPDVELALNETVDINSEAKFAGLLALLERLAQRGTPIDMVGLQSHFALELPPSREVLRSRLEAIAALGYKVELTELDIPLSQFDGQPDPLAAQAEAFASTFGACLDVPACAGVTVWGLYDAETWLDGMIPAFAPTRPLLLDESFQPKPAYWAVRDVLLEGRR